MTSSTGNAALRRTICGGLLPLLLGGCAVVRTDGDDAAQYRWHWGGLNGAVQPADSSPVVYNRYSAWGVVLAPELIAVGKVDYAAVRVANPERCHAVIVVESADQAARLAEKLSSIEKICVIENRRKK